MRVFVSQLSCYFILIHGLKFNRRTNEHLVILKYFSHSILFFFSILNLIDGSHKNGVMDFQIYNPVFV